MGSCGCLGTKEVVSNYKECFLSIKDLIDFTTELFRKQFKYKKRELELLSSSLLIVGSVVLLTIGQQKIL